MFLVLNGVKCDDNIFGKSSILFFVIGKKDGSFFVKFIFIVVVKSVDSVYY